MKKLSVLISLLIIFSLHVSGQRIKDALYLKNGSIILGKLLEISNDQCKMQSSDGSFFIYPMSEVEKLVKESPSFTGRKTEGLGMATEVGFLAGSQEEGYTAPFSFNLICNYTVATKNIFGIGSGVEFVGVPYMPLFAEYKYLIKDKRATPFFFGRAGWLFHASENNENVDPFSSYNKHDFKGGFSYGIGTGIAWARDDIETYISFAYRHFSTSYHQSSYAYNGNYYDYKYEDSYNRLELKFGFRF